MPPTIHWIKSNGGPDGGEDSGGAFKRNRPGCPHDIAGDIADDRVKGRMRFVVDTDVVVAAIRSPGGVSAALLVRLLSHEWTMLLSVTLAFEYEAVCTRPEHLLAAGVSARAARGLIDTILEVVGPVEVHYQWRPQLSDAADEMVLEAAVNGRANAIVTFNRKDFGAAPARFGIEVLSPGDALRRIRQ